MTGGGRLLVAGPPRALLEAGVAAGGLGLPLLATLNRSPATEGRVAAVFLGMFYDCLNSPATA